MEPHRRGGEKNRKTHWQMDAVTHNLAATRMQPFIKMHANRFALSLPLPGMRNQPKLLTPQNKENWKKDVPHFRAVVVNWLQGRLFIFCGDLKEKDLLVTLGTWDCSPSTIRGLSREMKINKHGDAPGTAPWNWGCEYKWFSSGRSFLRETAGWISNVCQFGIGRSYRLTYMQVR